MIKSWHSVRFSAVVVSKVRIAVSFADNNKQIVFITKLYLCYDSKEDTLFMAVILSLLRDGGELSLMNGDNDLGGINLPQLWL